VPAGEPAAPRARLLELLKTLSWQRGEVTLASGRRSDFYFDCRQTALHAEGAVLIGRLVFEHVRSLRQKGVAIDGVGGPTLGADPIATATAVHSFLAGEPVHAFIVRKEPKSHGTGTWLEGLRNLAAGSRVLVVEDVVTSGASMLAALERVRSAGLVPVALLCIVDRGEGGRDSLVASGLPYTSLFTRFDFDA